MTGKIYRTVHIDPPKTVLMRRYGIATFINFCFLRVKLSELNLAWQTVLRLKLGCDIICVFFVLLSLFGVSFFSTPCAVYIVSL